MKRWIAPIAFLFAAAACSANTPIVAPSSPEPSSPSPSPTSTAPPPPQVARAAVYAAEDAIWLYGVEADTNTKFAEGEGLAQAKFLDSGTVSFVQSSGASGTLRAVDLKTREVRDIFTVGSGINAYAWSPDRTTVAYVTTDPRAFPHLHFRSVVGDAPVQTVATLARAHGREFVTSDQIRLQYSPDGSHLLMVYTPADILRDEKVPPDRSQLQVRGADGSLAFGADMATDPTMAAWSADGTKVYFRAGGSVRSWTVGKRSSLAVRGVRPWFNPWTAPSGDHIAFDTGASTVGVRVQRFILDGAKVQSISPTGFFHPVVADEKTVWAQRVQKCEPDCLNSVVPGPEVVAFDLEAGTQTKLALTTLVDVDVLYG